MEGINGQNIVGRPKLNDDQKGEIVRKLEPYLKSGLSIRKACNEAQIPKSTVYDLIEKDKKFSDKIERFKNYLSIVTSQTFYRLLINIHYKIDKGEQLTNQEVKFLEWFSTHSKLTQEEFGEHTELNINDPEENLRKKNKLLDEKFGSGIPDKSFESKSEQITPT